MNQVTEEEMEIVKQLLLALGLLGPPVDHPPEPCLGNCQPSPAAFGIIQHFEGYAPIIYQDAAGYDTIGFGHLIKPGEKIEEPLLGEAAERLLLQDVQPKATAVNARVSVPLFQGQYDAVASWTSNLGEGALKSSTMLKKINAARHEEVPGQMKRGNRAGGKVLKGLERRREAEAAFYEMRWY
jgi:lysozyme